MKTAGQARVTLFPVSRFLAAVAAAALVLGVVQATNVVELPFVRWLCSPTGSVFSSGTLYDFMHSYGYLSLFVLMAAESASVPIPSEVVLPIAGFLVSEGALGSLAIVLVVSTVAALAGALFDYYLALFLGRPFVEAVLRVFRVDAARLDRAGGWFERSGQWTVLAARFVPLVRALVSFPAGLFRMKILQFVIMTAVGCIVWNAILLYAGFAAGSYVIGACAGSAGTLVITGFAVAAAVTGAAYLLYFGLKWRGSRSEGGGPTLPEA